MNRFAEHIQKINSHNRKTKLRLRKEAIDRINMFVDNTAPAESDLNYLKEKWAAVMGIKAHEFDMESTPSTPDAPRVRMIINPSQAERAWQNLDAVNIDRFSIGGFRLPTLKCFAVSEKALTKIDRLFNPEPEARILAQQEFLTELEAVSAPAVVISTRSMNPRTQSPAR